MGTSNISICNIQFEKSSTTFNGKPTWVNTGQNLTIKWDTDNDWWYIEGWSPGEQILSGNTIAPVGEWIPVGNADYFYNSSGEACSDCLSSFICLSDGTTQYDFELASETFNGKNTWTSGSYTIKWDSTNGYWFVDGWDQGGQLRHNVNDDNPVGSWVQVGLVRPEYWTATNEECPDTTFTTTLNVNNVGCQGLCNGTVTVIPTGGQTPFVYSNDGGTTFQNSNIFNGLCEGNGEVIVRDGNGVELTIPYVISYDAQVTNYTLNIVEFAQLLTNQNNYKKKQYTYNIVASPTLPSGSSLTFTALGKNIDLLKEPGTATFTHTWTKTINGVTTPISATPSSPTVTTATRTCASGNQTETTSTWNHQNTLLTLNSITSYIQIICVTEIQINTNSSDSTCPTYAETKTNFSLSSAKVNNVPCSSLTVPTTQTNQDTIFLQGLTIPQSVSHPVMRLNSPCVGGNCGTNNPSYSVNYYTQAGVTSLNGGTTVYSDSSLTNYPSINTYFQSGSYVYFVGPNGIISVYCQVGNSCTLP